MDISNSTHRAMARALREAWSGHDVSGYLGFLSDVSPDTIADLIDRPTCRIETDAGTPEWFSCSACGADMYAGGGLRPAPRYCPNCGAEVVLVDE